MPLLCFRSLQQLSRFTKVKNPSPQPLSPLSQERQRPDGPSFGSEGSCCGRDRRSLAHQNETVTRQLFNPPIGCHFRTHRSLQWLFAIPLIAALGLLTSVASLVAEEPDVAKVVEEIRAEALRSNEGPGGRPLPLAASWNTGRNANGFSPAWQVTMIEKGHHLLPWMAMPDLAPKKGDREYYEDPIAEFKRKKLPMTFIATQWERLLSIERRYLDLLVEENPNVVGPDGKVQPKLSPFGPPDLWREVGQRWGGTPSMGALEACYPDPPLVEFLSNNEQPKLRWTEADKSRDFLKRYGTGKDDDFKRQVIGAGWVDRYRALHDGLRSGLTTKPWQQGAFFVGYNAFGTSSFGRWPGWRNYSLEGSEGISVWPLAWDGASVPFYTNNWEPSTDYAVWSPQIEAMNWVFMLREAHAANPKFWFELSVWDGHEPAKADDKRKFYASQGQKFTPERYVGMVQFGMWLMRPRVVREFRGHQETLTTCEPYFTPIVEAVDRIYRDPTLTKFWREGELVANPAHKHPFQADIPARYRDVPRWFLLDTDLDPARPWKLHTQLPVFSLALVTGKAPKRSWLIYSHAPLKDQPSVRIDIPGHTSVQASASVGGTFHIVDEETGSVTRLP